MDGALIGKLGAVFTGAASVHGGSGNDRNFNDVSNASPWNDNCRGTLSVPELTQSGSPYGPSRIVGPMANKEIDDADIKVARALGKRVTMLAQKLFRE